MPAQIGRRTDLGCPGGPVGPRRRGTVSRWRPRADLLRREHLPARAAAARPRRDRARARGSAVRRPRCSCSTTARATARPRRRGAPGRGRDDRAAAQRRGKALNDSELLRRARGRYALLLNEDSELLPGATLALWQALEAHARRGLRGGAAAAPRRHAAGLRVALPDAADGARRRAVPAPLLTVQSRGARTREVDWCQSAALLVRRGRPPQVGYLDPDFFVYSDEVDFARRLRDAGWRSLYVPAAQRDPPRAALHRRGPRAADRRAGAQPRPVHAQAPLARRRAGGALADRLGLRAARARRARAAGPLAARATGATSPRRSGPAAAKACARRPRVQRVGPRKLKGVRGQAERPTGGSGSA